MALIIITTLLVIPAAFISLYYLILMITATIYNKKNCVNPLISKNKTKFAIIIPAHNEETTILKTIFSCKNVDYPTENYKIYVIADNCTDKTESITKEQSVECLVRIDKTDIGKGYALEWAFNKTLQNEHDAFVVIDADCEIDSHALKTFDLYLQNGDKVLQANDVSSNPDDSPMSYAVTVGNIIENNLFYMPKETMNLAIQLRGTGMVFAREILEQYPWSSSSVVEDMEYTVYLLKNKIKIRYVKEANVSSDFPVHKEQLEIQRTRWAGNLHHGKKDAFFLILNGLKSKNLILIDAGLNFLLLSRPLILLASVTSLILSTILFLTVPGMTSTILISISISSFIIQVIYFGSGILLLGLNKKRFIYLMSVPVIVTKLILISLRGILGINPSAWNRTPRDK